MLWGTQKKWKTQSLSAVLLSRSGCITRRGDDRSVYPTSREWLGIPLLRISGTPDTCPPPNPTQPWGSGKPWLWGRKEGARRQMKGLYCLKFCVTNPMKDPGEGVTGALLTFHCLWEPPLSRGQFQLTSIWLLAFPLCLLSGDPPGSVPWRF